MSYKYFEELSLSDEEKTKLANLGASTAAALLSLIQASPEPFGRLLGEQRAKELKKALDSMLSKDERTLLNSPPKSLPPLGAIIDQESPSPKSPRYDTDERDRLFEQLQHLRSLGISSKESRRRIAELEQALNTLLEDSN